MEVGTFVTEEAGRSVTCVGHSHSLIYTESAVLDSTELHPWFLAQFGPHLPKALLFLTPLRLHAGRDSTGGCAAPSLG